MAFDVSSWFLEQLTLSSTAPKRVFTISGSDYSERVVKWPKFKRSWNAIRPTNLAINLVNDDQGLNFLVDTPTSMTGSCDIRLGFTRGEYPYTVEHPYTVEYLYQHEDELIHLYAGTIEKAEFARGAVTLRLLDKMKAFTERVVGSSDEPVVFSGANLLPSDVAWTLCTCYGGLSNVQSDSNPDIEWSSFTAWAAVFSGDNVLVGAQYEGMKVVEALKRLSMYTDSAIFEEHGQVEFRRFSSIDSKTTVLDDDSIIDLSLTVDDAAIVNDQHVYADYSVGSDSWALDVISQDSASIEDYGYRENVLKDTSIWYINSVSAINVASKRTGDLSSPVKRFTIDSMLLPITRSLGETIRISDSFLGVTSSTGWRMMEFEVNVETGRTRVTADGSQLGYPFILDDAVYGLLDKSYNQLL